MDLTYFSGILIITFNSYLTITYVVGIYFIDVPLLSIPSKPFLRISNNSILAVLLDTLLILAYILFTFPPST